MKDTIGANFFFGERFPYWNAGDESRNGNQGTCKWDIPVDNALIGKE